MNKTQTSKLMVKLDYVIGIALILTFVFCMAVNVVYEYITTAKLIANGYPEYISSITTPIDLSQPAVIVTAWIAQLGISSAAYYFLCKSDHSIELPAKMIKELPKDLRSQVDPTQVMVAAITTK